MPLEMEFPAGTAEQQAVAQRRVIPGIRLIRCGVIETLITNLPAFAECELAESACEPFVVRLGQQKHLLRLAYSRVLLLFRSYRRVFLVGGRRDKCKAETELCNRRAGELLQGAEWEGDGHAAAVGSVAAGCSECGALRMTNRDGSEAVGRLGDVQSKRAAGVQDLAFVAGATIEEQFPTVMFDQVPVPSCQFDGQTLCGLPERYPAVGPGVILHGKTLWCHDRMFALEHGHPKDAI